MPNFGWSQLNGVKMYRGRPENGVFRLFGCFGFYMIGRVSSFNIPHENGLLAYVNLCWISRLSKVYLERKLNTSSSSITIIHWFIFIGQSQWLIHMLDNMQGFWVLLLLILLNNSFAKSYLSIWPKKNKIGSYLSNNL
jgi:hypothetical protein